MRRRLLSLLAVVLGALYLWNASWLAPLPRQPPRILAHRGLGQTFDLDGVDGETCTATRIHPPEHPWLENTIAGIAAAFDAGATLVEIDLHATADDRLAVFHDADLACRTDGTGRPEDHTLAALQALDVGYGYTADGGRSFPFRGKGVGALPSLDEVLAALPGRAFVLDLKTREPRLGRLVADRLAELPSRDGLWVTGGEPAIDEVVARFPEVRALRRSQVKACLKGYLLWGWSGHVPETCHDTAVLVPVNLVPALWGWPRRFQARMASAGTEVVVIGPWRGERFTRGVDDPVEQDALLALGANFGGVVWTNRVDLIATGGSR